MRGSKAKALRRASEYAFKRGGSDTVYEVKKHPPVLVPDGTTLPNGKPGMKLHTPETIVLGECKRKLYQHLKVM